MCKLHMGEGGAPGGGGGKACTKDGSHQPMLLLGVLTPGVGCCGWSTMRR